MRVKQWHKPSPSHHHFYRCYVYHSQMGASINGWYPKMVGLFHGKSQSTMDDDWGHPYFRKPPKVSKRRGAKLRQTLKDLLGQRLQSGRWWNTVWARLQQEKKGMKHWELEGEMDFHVDEWFRNPKCCGCCGSFWQGGKCAFCASLGVVSLQFAASSFKYLQPFRS